MSLHLQTLSDARLVERVQELRLKGEIRQPKEYAEVVGVLAERALWRQSCALLLEMRFRSMTPFPSTFASAAVACYKAAQNQEAAVIMDKLWSASGRRIDVMDCGNVVVRFANAGLWQGALTFLEEMQDHRVLPDAYAYNNVMVASRRKNDFSVAPLLLRSMQEKEVQADAWSYSQAMDASNAVGSWEASLEYLRQLQAAEVEPNSVILTTAITACQLGDVSPKKAVQLLREAQASGNCDVQAYTAAINACGKAGLWSWALSLLEEMPEAACQPNLFTYNAAIGACQVAQEWEMALAVFSSMRRKGTRPDTSSYNLLLSSCARCREQAQVERLVQRMYKQRLAPDEVTFNCLSSLIMDRRDRENFLEELKANGLRPGVRTYNPMISACAESQGWEEALTILADMAANEVAPDIKSHNRLLDVCASTASWVVVLNVFEALRSALPPNAATVNTCLGACASANRWLEAIGLLELMETEGPSPDVISYNTVIHACRHLGVDLAAGVLSRMEKMGIQPDVITFNTVLSSSAANWEWVLALLSNMEQRDFTNARSYSIALHALVQENQLHAALHLFKHVQVKGITLTEGAYNFLILAVLRVGWSQWAEHLIQKAIEEKVFTKAQEKLVDLHNMSGPVARFFFLLALRDRALRPSRNSLRVVFGLGRHNVKTPLVVKPEVLSLCEKLELSVRPPAEDEGSVQVQARSFTPRLNAELQKLLSEPELKRHFGSLPSTLEDELFQTAELALVGSSRAF